MGQSLSNKWVPFVIFVIRDVFFLEALLRIKKVSINPAVLFLSIGGLVFFGLQILSLYFSCITFTDALLLYMYRNQTNNGINVRICHFWFASDD